MALFGIKKIEYCAADSLAFSGGYNPFMGISSELTNTLATISCLVNTRATLAIEQQRNTKEVLYTSRLVFVTPTDPKLSASYFAFVATTNEGERILLGAPFRPRVVVTTEQTVAAGASDLTAYTTTVVFQTNYCPLRLPVTAATPVAGPAYDICCGAIKTEEPISGPAYDICCGEIKTEEPISGPAYDVCCGEIVGDSTMLTVIWQNYDGTEVDRATYPEGAPEPTTSVVPTHPSTMTTTYTFTGWNLYSQTATTKIYRAQYIEEPITGFSYIELTAQGEFAEEGEIAYDCVQLNGVPFSFLRDGGGYPTQHFAVAYNGNPDYWGYKAMAFKQNSGYTVLTADWADYFERYTDRSPIYDANNPNLIIGFRLNSYEGDLPPWNG